jgi:hypothetical protein
MKIRVIKKGRYIIVFVRFGGLSGTNQKKVNKIHRPDFKTKNYFHQAPKSKGIYAFIYPYIENFLWAFKANKIKDIWECDNDLLSTREQKEYLEDWERKENKQFQKEYKRLRRKFTYNGMIWCHHIDYVTGGRRKGSWVEIHTRELERILKKVMHDDMAALRKDSWFDGIAKNPYKRGLNGYMSKDCLEVFIEHVK